MKTHRLELRTRRLAQKELSACPGQTPAAQQLLAYLHRESKRRNGKIVSLVKGLSLSEADLVALAKQIKQACGIGGTMKEAQIEIREDHCEKIADPLWKLG